MLIILNIQILTHFECSETDIVKKNLPRYSYHSGRQLVWCQDMLKQNNTLSLRQQAILLSSFKLISRPNSDTYARAGFNNHSSSGILAVVCHPCCHDNQAPNFGLKTVSLCKTDIFQRHAGLKGCAGLCL